jgi:hypothetical protein
VDHKLELAALYLLPAQMGSKRLTQPQASIVDPNDGITLLKACKHTFSMRLIYTSCMSLVLIQSMRVIHEGV